MLTKIPVLASDRVQEKRVVGVSSGVPGPPPISSGPLPPIRESPPSPPVISSPPPPPSTESSPPRPVTWSRPPRAWISSSSREPVIRSFCSVPTHGPPRHVMLAAQATPANATRSTLPTTANIATLLNGLILSFFCWPLSSDAPRLFAPPPHRGASLVSPLSSQH